MKTPRVLFYDVETKPVKVWCWTTGKQYINHHQIVDGEKFEIICIAWKWLGEKKIHCLDWGKEQSSAKMLNTFVYELERADVVIGQNNNSFDDKQINMQRMLHGQPPIAWPTAEDVRKQVRKHFYITSSSLEYMAKLLTGEGKSRMQFADWVDIVDRRDAKALNKMKRYCMRDVQKLQEVWERIRPYVTPRVHRGVVIDGDRNSCPSCGAKDVAKWGSRYTTRRKVQRFQCRECRHTFT